MIPHPINSAFSTKIVSATAAEARLKAVRLFRAALHEVDNIIRNYQLEVTRGELRARIRQEFDKHANVKETRVVDMLVFKGTSELEEAKLIWKTKSHVVRFFNPERAGRSPAEMKKITAKREQQWANEAIAASQKQPPKSIGQMFSADKHPSSSL